MTTTTPPPPPPAARAISRKSLHAQSSVHRCLPARYTPPMHYDSHQSIIDDLEARILTMRDSL